MEIYIQQIAVNKKSPQMWAIFYIKFIGLTSIFTRVFAGGFTRDIHV